MTTRTFGIAIAALSGAIVLGSAVRAAEKKVDGKPVDVTVNCDIVQQQTHPLGAPDSVVVAEVGKGTTKIPGDPIDGADVLMSETVVLDKGNGIDHGTISFANDKGSITNAYWGTAKTMMVDGQPRTTTSGLYKMTVGTGIYAGGSGQGTYSASFTPKTGFVSEFKGVLKTVK